MGTWGEGDQIMWKAGERRSRDSARGSTADLKPWEGKGRKVVGGGGQRALGSGLHGGRCAVCVGASATERAQVCCSCPLGHW